jgi:tRNA(adenine34) deaminase
LPENKQTDESFMGLALREARRAERLEEVPVGAVVVRDGIVISRGHNLRESRNDPTAHAELVAIKKAAKKMGSWRLTGCTLYVTLEPCPMCAGAMVNSRISRVVYGCADPKAGACGTLMNLAQDGRLNHRLELSGGVLSDECAGLLRDFFRKKRKK